MSGEAVNAAPRARALPARRGRDRRDGRRSFAGTPYQWGGVTPWGADCSGLVQTVFWLHGVTLPRDAWQQAERRP